MKKGEANPGKLPIFGDGMMNKLAATSRKRRKRQASKLRRVQLRRQDSSE
jgi:hypothetical protein